MNISISITLVIVVITCIVSLTAFNNEKLMDDLIFDPPAIANQKQWYRFFTCGFIHANYVHLLFNMYSLWIFGRYVENMFTDEFGSGGKWLYLLMYLSSLYFCLLPTYSRNKDNYHYRSLGASGAVSAVVFAFIFMEPLQGLHLIGLDNFSLPGFVFGFIYLIVSSVLDKRGGGNINHSAHIWGALYGISFLIIVSSLMGHHLLQHFISQVGSYFRRF